MVWAATWSGRRFCVCGELNVRFRQPAFVGRALKVAARITFVRSRLIEVEGTLTDEGGAVIATAAGKYVPVSAERNLEVVETLVPEPAVEKTLQVLRNAASK
jgi:acyl-CoA thioesterase FadM